MGMSTPWKGKQSTFGPDFCYLRSTCECCGVSGAKVRFHVLILLTGRFSMSKRACDACLEDTKAYMLASEKWTDERRSAEDLAVAQARAAVAAEFGLTMPKLPVKVVA